ncbi:hypothetical protein ACJX0J_042424, partial [Zea mays]
VLMEPAVLNRERVALDKKNRMHVLFDDYSDEDFYGVQRKYSIVARVEVKFPIEPRYRDRQHYILSDINDEDVENLLEYHGFGLRQYEELYLVKEGPFLNSESDFPSGCSQLVHSKKSQRVVDDVSSGPDCAPTSKEKIVFPYTGQPVAGKRDLFLPQNAPAIPPDGRMDLDPSFPGPISITPDRQISPLFSDPFSPRAASKLFSSTHPKPLSPTDGRKDRFSSVLTVVSPHTGKRDILSKTPKVASPKAEGKTKLVNGLIAKDQDSGVAEIPQKVEMQTDILWSQANTQNTNALVEPIVSHPLADRMSLNYSSMYGAEDDFRAHVSGIGADMDEGTPSDHECLVIGAGLPISSPLSYHEEYEDHSISNGTNDDWLPIVMPAKKLISDENLKAILRKWRQHAADKRLLREQKNALDISLLHGLGIKFVLVPGTHIQIDKLLSERGNKAKYVGQYIITDEDARKAAMDAAGRIRLTIEAKLSPGPPMLNLRRHGVIRRWHGLLDSIASGNFLGAKRRGVVNGIDYRFTGEVTKIDVSRIRERLDSDSIVVISNMGFSSSGDVLNCNTYEVATACALALEADKLICVVDGQVFDEHGRTIQYMSIEEADLLIRKRARQSDIAASYVKVVDEEGINSLHKGDNRPSLSPKAYINGYAASFQNGLGFNNGNDIYSGEQGFAIERLSRSNGYLSELVAAAYVCH